MAIKINPNGLLRIFTIVVLTLGLNVPSLSWAVPITYIAELVDESDVTGFYPSDQNGVLETSRFYSFYVSPDETQAFGHRYSFSPGYVGVLKIYAGLYDDTATLDDARMLARVYEHVDTNPTNGSMAFPLVSGFYTVALNSYLFLGGRQQTSEPTYTLRLWGISSSSTIPEPNTFAMLAFGLLLSTLVAGRKHS